MKSHFPSVFRHIIAGFLLPAVIFSACGPAATATPAAGGAAATPAAGQPTEAVQPTQAAAPATFDLKAQSQETVELVGWQFATDVVANNVARYNNEMGGHVVYSTIAGDYSSIMESKLLMKAPVDVLYGQVYDAVRFYEGGWITPIDELPNYQTIKDDFYPTIADYFTYKGHLLGLSYYMSVLGVVTVNLDQLQKAGLTEADYPATWHELYDQLYKIRDAGIKHPYLPSWYNEQWGIPWSFMFEVMNRGGTVADPETHAPMMTVDGPAGDTLRDWKRLYNDGIVEPEVLSYKEADFLQAWESGRYVYSPTMAYNIKSFNDPKSSTFAGKCSFIPYKGQPWGGIDTGLYMMTNQPRSPEKEHDVMAFLSWYGYKDQKGEAFTALRWLKDFNLFSGYKSVMESPQAKAEIATALSNPNDVDKLLEIYTHAAYPKGVFNAVWSAEFQTFLRETIGDFLLKDLPVEDTINALNNKITELNKTYGINQ